MGKDKLPISVIINKWKEKCFVKKTSDRGTTFLVLPNSCRMDCLAMLAKTFSDYGYTYEEMDHHMVSVKIADVCWRDDKIVKMSGTEIAKAKLSVAKDWQEIIDSKYAGVVISELEEHEKPVYKEEPKVEPVKKSLEIEPKDRIKMDTSDMVDGELDLDFLSELGVDESFLNGKKDE